MSLQHPLMAGKRGLIMGVANDRSLAWGIAKAVAAQGAELAFTFQGDALAKRVRPLAAELGSKLVLDCDVTNTASMDAVFATLKQEWGQLDFLVHAIAYSDKEELKGRYVDTSPENFALSMNVSCYSFTALAKRAEPLMTNGGSLVTLTYYGAERVMPHYNVMGVAKAALEASVRYMAVDLGPQGHPGQCDFRRPDQDAGGQRDRRFPLYPEVERTEFAAAAQRDHRPGRLGRTLSAQRDGLGCHRRGTSRGQWLSHRRHGRGGCRRTGCRTAAEPAAQDLTTA